MINAGCVVRSLFLTANTRRESHSDLLIHNYIKRCATTELAALHFHEVEIHEQYRSFFFSFKGAVRKNLVVRFSCTDN